MFIYNASHKIGNMRDHFLESDLAMWVTLVILQVSHWNTLGLSSLLAVFQEHRRFPLTWRQAMKTLTSRQALVCECCLPSWGARDTHSVWLNMLKIWQGSAVDWGGAVDILCSYWELIISPVSSFKNWTDIKFVWASSLYCVSLFSIRPRKCFTHTYIWLCIPFPWNVGPETSSLVRFRRLRTVFKYNSL